MLIQLTEASQAQHTYTGTGVVVLVYSSTPREGNYRAS